MGRVASVSRTAGPRHCEKAASAGITASPPARCSQLQVPRCRPRGATRLPRGPHHRSQTAGEHGGAEPPWTQRGSARQVGPPTQARAAAGRAGATRPSPERLASFGPVTSPVKRQPPSVAPSTAPRMAPARTSARTPGRPGKKPPTPARTSAPPPAQPRAHPEALLSATP